MVFKVIQGGLSSDPAQKDDGTRHMSLVVKEGRRRLADIGYDRWATKAKVTGTSVPAAVEYFRLQVDYVVKALLSLETVPEDFQSDIYWPAAPALR
jgi:hypothetical protein